MHYSLATCEPWHDTALITLAWEMGSQTEKLPLQSRNLMMRPAWLMILLWKKILLRIDDSSSEVIDSSVTASIVVMCLLRRSRSNKIGNEE